MNTTKASTWTTQLPVISLIDLGIIAVLYVLPGITHLLPIPIYLIDPMRLLLFLTLLTTNRMNSLLLAASIPLISTFFSGHPIFPKNILIAAELSLNVVVFHWILAKRDSIFLAGIVSILSAKAFYYLLKMGLITMGLLGGVLISTALTHQLIPLALIPLMLVGMDSLKRRHR